MRRASSKVSLGSCGGGYNSARLIAHDGAVIDATENAIRQAETDARARSAASSFLAESVALVGLLVMGKGGRGAPWNSAPGAEEGSLMPATLSSSQCIHSSGSTSRGCLLL